MESKKAYELRNVVLLSTHISWIQAIIDESVEHIKGKLIIDETNSDFVVLDLRFTPFEWLHIQAQCIERIDGCLIAHEEDLGDWTFLVNDREEVK